MNALARQPIQIIRPIPALTHVLDALLATPIASCWFAVYEWDIPGAEAEILAWAQSNGLSIERDNNPAVPAMRVKRGGRVLAVWYGERGR